MLSSPLAFRISKRNHPELTESQQGLSKLEHMVYDVVDCVKQNFDTVTVTELYAKLQDRLFKVRLHFIASQNSLDVVGIINEAVKQSNLKNEANHLFNLKYAFVNTLSVYAKVISHSEIPYDQISRNSAFPAEEMDYQSFKEYLSTLPGSHAKTLIEFTEASLQLEFYLILADLILQNEVKPSTEKLNFLTDHLKLQLETFAVGMSRLDLWQPDEEDESAWIRNIKIRISLADAQGFKTLTARGKTA